LRPVDQRVLALRFDLRAVGHPHHHADLSAQPEIDLGLRRGPVRRAVEPAPHHLGAGPCVEDVLSRSRERPLDTHHVTGLLAHRRSLRSSRYSPTTSKRRSQPSRWLCIQSEPSASASRRKSRRGGSPSTTRLKTRSSPSS